ncbi:MAG TPA: hypothetical protein PKM41_08975 [Deltaproteobacteria bacterium]|nr:hypothetical protein [Deltaproteobacteria bacterium]HOI07410.1 hypothetical protein [Deltaproteobacteria bacterium]
MVNESWRPKGTGADDVRSFFVAGVVIVVVYCVVFRAIQVRNMRKG